MENTEHSFRIFFWRITSTHIITYTITGIIAMLLLNYREQFETGTLSLLMKPIDSPWVMAGPVLQVTRGLLFSIVLWPFRTNILYQKNGWLKLWLLFLGLAILGTSGPSPGSIEGMIYTKLPLLMQIAGMQEVIVQTLVFSLLVYFWYEKPKKIWNVLAASLVLLIFTMIITGIMAKHFNMG